MKKLLIAFLLSLTCACTVAGAVSCVRQDDSSTDSSSSSPLPDSSSPSDAEKTLSVEFVNGEGYTFVPEAEEGTLFAPGETVRFRLKVGAFYTGNAVVYCNETAIPALDNDRNYEVTIEENSTFTAINIKKDVSAMSGTGSLDDAFVVTRPIDLLYIAEQVNAGNSTYVTGSYVLANDIDCGGEELEIIGDLSTEHSYFAGCFATTVDSESGEFERHTISNFVINSDDTNYVGLFGAVYVDLSVTSSGLFYGINLDNFTVNARLSANAQVDNRSISAGSLIGFGSGAKVWLCDATNGRVNVYGDSNYFSYAGGLIGYQQGLYSKSMGASFPSEVVYSAVDVDVRILSGMGLCAGGVAGYVASNSATDAAAYIHNSYATGTVSGALRSGGLVGGLGSYASISNCYATGNVSAKSTKSPDDPLITDTKFCYAYAGGLVGYAENESIVNDSFATGSLSASAVNATGYTYTDAFVAGGDKAGTATAAASKYVVQNCLTKDELDLADTSFFTNTLGWGKYDWNFKKNEYPTVCLDATTTTVTATLTVYYVSTDGTKITIADGDATTSDDRFSVKFFDTSIESLSAYNPLGSFFGGGLSTYMRADNGYLSFGYFFDETCTKKVPYAYVPQKDVTLYIGFADPTPLLNKTFYLTNGDSSSAHTLTFDEEGIATYSDGRTFQKAYYLYDGETIVIEQARLARYYYDGKIVIDTIDTSSFQAPNFDMYRYSYYDFAGTLKGDVLTLYDGTYFTQEAPLTYSTSHVNEPNPLDAFAGSWTKSANVNKVYTFDGKGNWEFAHKAYERNGYTVTESLVSQANGTYTIENGKLYFTHGEVEYVATLEDDCLLVKGGGKTQRYYAEGSFTGTWNGSNFSLALEGIGGDGLGNAVLTDADGYVYELVYEMSETDGYVALYYPHDVYGKDALYGYFNYELASNTLKIVLPDDLTGNVKEESLLLLDNYNGEWICDADKFLHVEFRFDGNGLYAFLYGQAGTQGKLMLIDNGVETELDYTLDSTLQGTFTYDGVKYVMTYDEDANAVVLSANQETAELERKDALANIDFVDLRGNHYAFDGRSNLKTNGILTTGDKTYTYLYDANGDGWLVKDGETEVGTMTRTDNCYTLTLNGVATKLYIANEFMGNWAVGGRFGLFEIGPTDLDNVIQATFLGHPVEVTQMDVNLLTFDYKEGRMPFTYYVYIIHDAKLGYDVLVLSQYTSLVGGSYSICTKANELYGSWVSADGFTLRFDGLTNGAYANGTAALSWKNSTNSTPYYYTMSEKGIMLWSQETLGGSYVYYKLELLETADPTDKNIFVQRDEEGNVIKALRRTKVDSLYMTEAKDLNDENVVYFFDGEGRLLVGDEVAYTYEIRSFNTDNTVYLTLTKDGVKYFAVLDYGKSENVTLKITLEEETPENKE